MRVWEEGVKRPITQEARFLVAVQSKVKNEKGVYILTDEMKEQAISMARDYYQDFTKDAGNLKIEVELTVDRKFIDHVVCPDGIVPNNDIK